MAKSLLRNSAYVERDEHERAGVLGAVGEFGASGPQEGKVDSASGFRVGCRRSGAR